MKVKFRKHNYNANKTPQSIRKEKQTIAESKKSANMDVLRLETDGAGSLCELVTTDTEYDK